MPTWTVSAAVRELMGLSGAASNLSEAAQEALAERLEAQNLQVEALQREVEEWAKRYGELQQRLVDEPDSERAQRAKELLQAGKLAEAGAELDALIAAAEQRREQETRRLASYHLSRAQAYSREFKPLQALEHYKKGYDYQPEDLDIAYAYGGALMTQRDYQAAQTVFMALVSRLRTLAEANPSAYRPYVAKTLNNLGISTPTPSAWPRREQVYEEALATYRELAAANPYAYRPDVAGTLNNLGLSTATPAPGRGASRPTRKRSPLSRSSPRPTRAYRPYVAMRSTTWGISTAPRSASARRRRSTRRRSPSAGARPANPSLPAYLATTLNNLGNLYSDQHRMRGATGLRGSARLSPASSPRRTLTAYLPNVAVTLNNLGNFISMTHGWAEAGQAY